MKINKKMIFIGILALLIGILAFFYISSQNKLDSNKKVDGLLITDTKINFNSSLSVSFLSAKVKNISKEDKKDIKLKITFLTKSKKEITSVTGF